MLIMMQVQKPAATFRNTGGWKVMGGGGMGVFLGFAYEDRFTDDGTVGG